MIWSSSVSIRRTLFQRRAIRFRGWFRIIRIRSKTLSKIRLSSMERSSRRKARSIAMKVT